jgi:hypothetical protein
LKIIIKKTIKSIKIKIHLNISIMYPLGINVLTNKNKVISKGLLKIRSNYDLSKVHKYHLVKVSQKNIHFKFHDFIIQALVNHYKQFGVNSI